MAQTTNNRQPSNAARSYGKSGGDGGSTAGGAGRGGGHVAGDGERVPGGRGPAAFQDRRPQGHRRNAAVGVRAGDPVAARRAGNTRCPWRTHVHTTRRRSRSIYKLSGEAKAN